MADRIEMTPRAQLLAMSRGYILARAIHVAAELGVADLVGAEPVTVDELARRTRTSPPHLERLLRLLAGHGIFREASAGAFAATPLSDAMRDDAPDSLGPGCRMVNDAWWAAVGDLGHAIRNGRPGFSHRHDGPFFAYLKDHPDDQQRFDAGMAANSRTGDRAIAAAYPFDDVRTVIDLGGGRGGLVRAILERFPHVKGMVFEQPQVLERVVPPTELAVADRFSTVAGDLFAGVPAGVDVYLIKGVLHDFDDAQCTSILAHCRRAMAPHSRLLVVERRVLPDNAPHEAKTIDVLMMALLGGRERSDEEWEALFRASGLELVRRVDTASEFTISEARALDGTT